MSSIIREDIQSIVRTPLLDWSVFENKTVLVTGASGMLASYMVETILNLPVSTRVIAVVRNKKKAEQRFNYYLERSNFSIVQLDLLQPICLTSKIDFIIHAASQASPKYYYSDPVGTLLPNSIGTYNILEFARKNNVSNVLFFSSAEIYGKVDAHIVQIQETEYGYLDPCSIRSCYAESKRIGETMCVSWARQYGLNAKIVRPFHSYGPGLSLDDGRIFADFISNILNNENLRINGDGKAIRSFCYIRDATLAFFTIMLNGCRSEAYNVGNPSQSVSVKELANILVEAFPHKKLHIDLPVGNESLETANSVENRYIPDISKVLSLGWKPEVSIKEGFLRTVQSYLS